MDPTRRQFLIFGVAATAVLTTAYAGLRQIGTYPAPKSPHIHLGPKTVAIFALLGDFLIPPGGPLPGHAGDAETLDRIDALLDSVPLDMRRLILALPLAFEHGTALDRYGARALTQLPPDRQEAYLTEWAAATDLTSGQLWLGLKTVYGLTYFDRPDVQRAMGLAPHCRSDP